MDSIASQLLDYVNQHREWAGWVVFALSVVETTPIVSTFLFSTPFLVGMGALVAAGAMDFLPIFIGAFAGAVTGSTFAWWVGHHFGRAILRWKPVKAHPDWVQKASDGMNRWGIWAVAIGHVFAPLTSLIFLVAGMTRVSFLRFELANVPGALAWAYLIPKSGEWGGDLAHHLWVWLTGAA
jgi:membrane protein DedA with SNARE-associated domain